MMGTPGTIGNDEKWKPFDVAANMSPVHCYHGLLE